MNVNKNDIVYAIYKDGGNYYRYRKEKFINYENNYPICTVNMQDGIKMGYEEICIIEKEAISRINRLNKIEKKQKYNANEKLKKWLKGL